MCGRLSITKQDLGEIAAMLDATLEDPAMREEWKPRYNAAPSDTLPALRREGDRRELFRAIWGLGERHAVNMRASAVKRRGFERCLIPADGFFEWKQEGKIKQPWWYSRADGRILLLAALYERTPEGPRFTILTTDPNAEVARIHDRMPVVIDPDRETVDRWLGPGPAQEVEPLLAPPPDGTLVARPVSRRANSVKNDDPAVLGPAEPSDQPKLL
jgi:putative SOS response-associated peptidase YedK